MGDELYMTTRRDFLRTLIAGGAAVAVTPNTLLAEIGKAFAHQSDGPFELIMPGILMRIKPPVFPKRDFVITKFGAKPNGTTDSTAAFREAISACNKAGGGRVVVPAGTFLTGAIHLKSNVNLHVSPGATIKFSRDPNHYLPVVFTRWEGVELMNYSSFIYAFEQKNIAVTGTGTLDGQSDKESWWNWNGSPRTEYGWKPGMPNQRNARKALMEMSEKGVPVAERMFGAGHYLRPNFIQPYRCQNVLLEGVTIRNSP